MYFNTVLRDSVLVDKAWRHRCVGEVWLIWPLGGRRSPRGGEMSILNLKKIDFLYSTDFKLLSKRNKISMNDCTCLQFMLWLLAPGAKNSSYVMAWSGNYVVKLL